MKEKLKFFFCFQIFPSFNNQIQKDFEKKNLMPKKGKKRKKNGFIVSSYVLFIVQTIKYFLKHRQSCCIDIIFDVNEMFCRKDGRISILIADLHVCETSNKSLQKAVKAYFQCLISNSFLSCIMWLVSLCLL